MQANNLYVAASNSTDEAKRHADLLCSGQNDQHVLQQAIDRCITENKNIFLFNGIYRIDGFSHRTDGGPPAALTVPNAHRELRIVGQNNEYGFQKRFDNGVVFYVSASALESAPTGGADVLRGAWTKKGIQNGSGLYLENLAIFLANNQHAVRCIDLRRTDRVELKNITLLAYADRITENQHLSECPPVPASECVGLTMTDGSNYNYSNYTNVFAYGFGEGIQVGGEHVVCVNCGAALCRYGFTFGNYELNCGSNHPITLINCLDERNLHLPLFGPWCGDSAKDGGRLVGGQEVTMINYNIERIAKVTPGGVLGDCMREVIPGSWCGRIEFTAQPAWNATNTVDFQLWEADGSGSGFQTRNSRHRTVCTTEERLSYYPSLGQQVFDTDLGRMVICVNPHLKTWVDFSGNPV